MCPSELNSTRALGREIESPAGIIRHSSVRESRLATSTGSMIDLRVVSHLVGGRRRSVRSDIGWRKSQSTSVWTGTPWGKIIHVYPCASSLTCGSFSLIIDFQEEVPGVALGQVAAIWYEKWCLGSGVIKETWTADEVPIQQMDSKSWTSDNYWKYDAYVSAGMSIGSDARGRFGARPEEIEAARAEPSIDDSARDRLLEEGPDDEVAPGVEEGDEGSDREQTVQVVPSDRMTRQEAKQLVSNHGFWIEERIPQKGRRRPGRRKRRPLSLPSTTTLSRNNHSTHIVTKSASHSISASREDLHSS